MRVLAAEDEMLIWLDHGARARGIFAPGGNV